MPIQVTCPGCLARFSVSDKYAGKKGPCPKCKKEITVPEKSQEVVIHAPEPTGPKDSKGVSVLKPIKRAEFKLSTLQKGLAIGITAGAILLAVAGRFAFDTIPWWYAALGVLALAYPSAWAGYTFLKDDELGGYLGQELTIRLGACAGIFALTWGLYWLLGYYLGNKSIADIDTVTFAILLALMTVAGTFGSLGSLELEFGQSFLHYMLYLAATILLALVAGVELAEPFSGGSTKNPHGIPNIKIPANY